MNTLSVKRACIGDADCIAELAKKTFIENWSSLFHDRTDLLAYIDHHFSVAKIRSSLGKINNVFLLAFYHDEPVGYAKLKKYSPSQFSGAFKTSQLQKIYILKDYSSKGIGRILLHQIVEETKKIRSEHLWLSVFEENVKAKDFYSKNGFSPTGEQELPVGKEKLNFSVMGMNL